MQQPATFTDERASAARQHDARLFFNLSIYNDDAGDETGQPPVTLVGYTRSVSTHTLSLVGPFYHFGYRYLMGHDRSLQIMLHLPNIAINIQGFPVRYTRISEHEMDDGYMLTGLNVNSSSESDVNCLIEVSIVVMSDADRLRFTQYLRQLAHVPAEGATMPQLMERPPQTRASYRASL
jgi:hypothetical protein